MSAARAKAAKKRRKKPGGKPGKLAGLPLHDAIRSMTGFGRGTASRDGIRATVEIRSVNHLAQVPHPQAQACQQDYPEHEPMIDPP